MAPQPLAGLKIVITRPREQALTLTQLIKEAGGIPLLYPLLDIAPAPNPAELQAQVARLGSFNLAIFISPNAVHYGMEAIRSCQGIPTGLRFAAVGQGSARALREQGVTAIIAPQERFDSEALLAQPELQHVQGRRIMIFRGNGGRELLGDTLRQRGAEVEYAECYVRSKPDLDLAGLLQAGPDALTVTSSEALAYLWERADPAARQRLAGVQLFAPHVRIAEAARALGWRNVQATGGGDEGLLAGLVAWAGQRRE
jgi:uroporphyrinogen-III synthase